jgi:hypothetical protein
MEDRVMRKRVVRVAALVGLFALGFIARDVVSLWRSGSTVMAQEAPAAGTNYLYILEYELGDRLSPREYFAEAVKLAKAIRATGEYKSVRVFNHNTGPHLSVYVFVEPKSWQAIETGANKWIESTGALDKPWIWKSHSDNLLTELSLD